MIAVKRGNDFDFFIAVFLFSVEQKYCAGNLSGNGITREHGCVTRSWFFITEGFGKWVDFFVFPYICIKWEIWIFRQKKQ